VTRDIMADRCIAIFSLKSTSNQRPKFLRNRSSIHYRILGGRPCDTVGINVTKGFQKLHFTPIRQPLCLDVTIWVRTPIMRTWSPKRPAANQYHHAGYGYRQSHIHLRCTLSLHGIVPLLKYGKATIKYWEIIADKLSAAGWTWGCCSAVTHHGWHWVVAPPHRAAAIL